MGPTFLYALSGFPAAPHPMGSTANSPRSAWTDEPPPLVRWRSWPIRDNVVSAALVTAALVGAGVLVFGQTERIHLAAAAVAALAVAGWRFFVPVTFELNAEGVHQWVLGRHYRIPWSEIRRHQIFSSGALVMPFEKETPIDLLHGLFLPWGRRREEILAQLRYHLDPPANA